MSATSLFLAKRATGAMFFSLFGGVFFIVGYLRGYGFHPLPMLLIVAATLSIFGGALYRYKQNKYALQDEEATPRQKKEDRIFHFINAGQWVVILVGGNILANIGLSDWVIPMAICIIGIHFLPLAKLFHYAPHYITGDALVIWAITYPLLLHGGGTHPVGCFVPGGILWVSATYALNVKPRRN